MIPCVVMAVAYTTKEPPSSTRLNGGSMDTFVMVNVCAEGLEPPDPIKRPDLQSGTLPVTLYTHEAVFLWTLTRRLTAEPLLLLFLVFPVRDDRLAETPQAFSLQLGKFLTTGETALGHGEIFSSALVTELRAYIAFIFWFPVFSHRVKGGIRTLNHCDHNAALCQLSYRHTYIIPQTAGFFQVLSSALLLPRYS